MGSYLAYGPKIYPKAHENPRAFSCIFGSIFLESSIQCPWGVGLHYIYCRKDGRISPWVVVWVSVEKTCRTPSQEMKSSPITRGKERPRKTTGKLLRKNYWLLLLYSPTQKGYNCYDPSITFAPNVIFFKALQLSKSLSSRTEFEQSLVFDLYIAHFINLS